jgi:lipid-A-disaccharide synthase-like uncharacterized protein
MFGTCFETGGAELHMAYVFLSLALAGFVTAAVLSVQWLVQLLGTDDRGSEKHRTFS